jgi:hypothetical protein
MTSRRRCRSWPSASLAAAGHVAPREIEFARHKAAPAAGIPHVDAKEKIRFCGARPTKS